MLDVIVRSLIVCLLTGIPAFTAPSLAGSPLSAPPASGLAKGTFLVAHPGLQDPNFQQTVVLICEHSDEGTLGIIVNRPTDVPVSEALPQLSILRGTSYRLHAGGPVQTGTVLMLFRLAGEPGALKKIMDQVYLGVDRQLLERIITHPEPTETFRAYAGYAGWAPGQLEFEMGMGSWLVAPADSASLFDKAPESLWEELVEKIRAPRVIRDGEGLPARDDQTGSAAGL